MHSLSALVTKCCSVVIDSPISHWGSRGSNLYPYMVKGKAILVTYLDRACLLQEAEAPRFHDNRHMGVLRFQPYTSAALTRQEMFLAFISVRGCVVYRAIVSRKD